MPEIAGDGRNRQADGMGDGLPVPGKPDGREQVFGQADADQPDLDHGRKVHQGEPEQFVGRVAAAGLEDKVAGQQVGGQHADEVGDENGPAERHGLVQDNPGQKVDQRGYPAHQQETVKPVLKQPVPHSVFHHRSQLLAEAHALRDGTVLRVIVGGIGD